jgi:hypothetical protein
VDHGFVVGGYRLVVADAAAEPYRSKPWLKGVEFEVGRAGLVCDEAPRAGFYRDGERASGSGGADVVVEAVTDVGDLVDWVPLTLMSLVKNSTEGLVTPQSSEVASMSQGRLSSRRKRPAWVVWLPTMPTK